MLYDINKKKVIGGVASAMLVLGAMVWMIQSFSSGPSVWVFLIPVGAIFLLVVMCMFMKKGNTASQANFLLDIKSELKIICIYSTYIFSTTKLV